MGWVQLTLDQLVCLVTLQFSRVAAVGIGLRCREFWEGVSGVAAAGAEPEICSVCEH